MSGPARPGLKRFWEAFISATIWPIHWRFFYRVTSSPKDEKFVNLVKTEILHITMLCVLSPPAVLYGSNTKYPDAQFTVNDQL